MKAFKNIFKTEDKKSEQGEASPEIPDDDEPLSEEEKNSLSTEVLEEQNKSILWAILKQIKVGSEVKHLQLPIFVLQPRSLLEKLTDSFVHPELLLEIPKINDPEQRFVAVLRFFLSGWHVRPKGVRNPLNPVIGEVFKCAWQTSDQPTASTSSMAPPAETQKEPTITHNPCPPLPVIDPQDSNSYYVAEQLSHHPPKTAFCYYNIGQGVAINSNLYPSYVKFYGNSAETKFNGTFHLSIVSPQFGVEDYEISLPGAVVRGILFGTLVLEIVGKSSIVCKQTGYNAEIEFQKKGMFRGKINSISGKIYKGKDTVYTVGGFWDSVSTLTNTQTKETVDLFDASKYDIKEKIVESIENQLPHESRRYWDKVVSGMLKNDEEEALGEKRRLEGIQREGERERKEKSIHWEPQLFVAKDDGSYLYKHWDEIINKMKAAKNI